MMYVITYDLHQGIFHDYQPLFDEIIGITQGRWWKYMDKTWIIAADVSLDDITNRLIGYMGNDDNLLVIPLTQSCSGWLPHEAWEWINRVTGEEGVG